MSDPAVRLEQEVLPEVPVRTGARARRVRSRRGQFQLRSLDFWGTTWYELSSFPTAQWQLYAEAIVHQVHGRVLEHIRALSETESD